MKYIDVRQAQYERMQKAQRPKIVDKEVSKILGMPIYTTDPRLIKLVAKWKKEINKSDDDLSRDDFLYSPKHIAELKKAFEVRSR